MGNALGDKHVNDNSNTFHMSISGGQYERDLPRGPIHDSKERVVLPVDGEMQLCATLRGAEGEKKRPRHLGGLPVGAQCAALSLSGKEWEERAAWPRALQRAAARRCKTINTFPLMIVSILISVYSSLAPSVSTPFSAEAAPSRPGLQPVGGQDEGISGSSVRLKAST
ncbi:hypothetical protein EYF80_033632 [Liparis tanakae]|uniref:Uncharacterized protein n=1 Tax=Liparis tanakae TaxID=230148 RepID=A0A4Z2GRG7_9TELE|nr:hypothetical protein EYF80_033632 [Liparis tanakae]